MSHYFRDKRELTREVIASRRNDVMAFHTQLRLGALDSLEALQAWAAACVAELDTVYLVGGCVYGSLAGELLEADNHVLDDLAAGYDRWLELFSGGINAMRRRGELRADADPRHLAVSLVTAHQGGAMISYANWQPRAAANGSQCRGRRRALVRTRGHAPQTARHTTARAQILNCNKPDRVLRPLNKFGCSGPRIMDQTTHFSDHSEGKENTMGLAWQQGPMATSCRTPLCRSCDEGSVGRRRLDRRVRGLDAWSVLGGSRH
jgi:AcrR family transcriptional regulator